MYIPINKVKLFPASTTVRVVVAGHDGLGACCFEFGVALTYACKLTPVVRSFNVVRIFHKTQRAILAECHLNSFLEFDNEIPQLA